MNQAASLSHGEIAQKIGNQLVKKLQGLEDTASIRYAAIEACEEFQKFVPNENTYRTRLGEIRKIVQATFPDEPVDRVPIKGEKKPGFYYTDRAKGNIKRWQHIAIYYITDVKSQQDRLEPEQANFADPEQNNLEPKAAPQIKSIEEEEPLPKVDTLPPDINNMTIESLNLDAETQQMVENAITQSGKSLAEFVQKACQVYARTVTGKERKYGEDISNIPTKELRDEKTYATNPNRADELVNRAIRAVMSHNGSATEASHKWLITQTLLAEMSGSKAATVKKIMIFKESDINNHNQRLKDDHGLNEYSNRKDKQFKKQFMEDWVNLALSGID